APTVRNEDALVETHLLGFTGDLIGKTIEIIFHRRLRPEQRFSSLEDLKAAIRRDLDTVRAHFSS
ncbi:MAG TPA: riboflavin kinase, partial [Candidatus Hydrogenedentes bacterium]|nr:riboflavin kinase [Candidatus Hydrogenedentota bacterium]